MLFGQEFSISGLVKDGNNNPIAYSNVIILIPSDSTIVNGSISDEKGRFKIANINAGDYILKASFLGFKAYSETISLSKNLNVNYFTC